MYFPVTSGIIFQRKVADVKAVDGVTFDIRRGETLGLVGRAVAARRRWAGGAPAVQADGRLRELPGSGPDLTRFRRPAADAPPHADDLPGPLRVTEPAHDVRQHHRRAADHPRPGGRAAKTPSGCRS